MDTPLDEAGKDQSESTSEGHPTHVPQQPGRLRRSLVPTLVTLLMIAVAVTGATTLIRQRLDAQTHVTLGQAVLAASQINIGPTDAATVTTLSVTSQSKVKAGQVLAKVKTANSGSTGGPAVETLRAPANATVVSVLGAVGTTLRAGEPLVTLYDPKQLTFHVDVPVAKLRGLRIGMSVSVSGAGTSRTILTKIDSVLPQVGTQAAPAPDDLTIVLRPTDPTQVASLVPGLPFTATADTGTAKHGTPVLDSA